MFKRLPMGTEGAGFQRGLLSMAEQYPGHSFWVNVNKNSKHAWRRAGLGGLLLALGLLWYSPAHAAEPAGRWWKGNIHTHTLWSDGDDYPEMVTDWYKKHGYNFLALSDHNVVMSGVKWTTVTTNASSPEAFNKYMRRFGPNWVTWKYVDGRVQTRLKTLAQFRGLFEEPGKFLLIPSEEITDAFKSKALHLNATNLRYLIKPQHGKTVIETLQNNVDAVIEQRERTGQPMFPHINHPNFTWALTAEEIMQVKGEKYFEVYNGHPQSHNEGDKTHSAIDRMYDIILTKRLAELNYGVMYALAVDDSHHYHQWEIPKSNPGRGWIMVRSARLSPDAIVTAMEAGDFYSTTGVRLRDVVRGSVQYRISIEAEPGVTYKTRFIGTRVGYDPSSTPIKSEKGEELDVTRKYSDTIGQVLAEVEGPEPAYTYKGDEIYVRAIITSSKLKELPYIKNELETAWTQPRVK